MAETRADSLEDALRQAEADADAAIKAASNVVNTLKRYRKAAQQGQIRELRTATEGAKRTLQTLDQEVANLAESWEFDEESYLQSGEYLNELIAQANDNDLSISLQDGRIFCYPAILRMLPGERAVQIDKQRERRIRPSVLVRLLRDLQKRPPRFRATDFLSSLHDAYKIEVDRRPGRLFPGASVPLNDLYELLTLMPGATREYSRQEFTRDVYLLDQSGETTTKSGERLEFHASTGTKLRRGTLTIITPSGQEKRYYAVAFAPAAGG
jgi:hypothetical protein